jgi:hypothetical protein
MGGDRWELTVSEDVEARMLFEYPHRKSRVSSRTDSYMP